MADEKVQVTDTDPEVVTDAGLKADLEAAATKLEEVKQDEVLAFHSLPTKEFEDAAKDSLTDAEKEIAKELEKARQAILANPHHLIAQLDQVDTSGTSGRTDSQNVQAANVAFVHPGRSAALASSKLRADKQDEQALKAALLDPSVPVATVLVDKNGKLAK